MKKNIIRIVTMLFVVLVLYYFMLPPLNPSDPSFWSFLVVSFVLCMIISSVFTLNNLNFKTIINNKKVSKNKTTYIISICAFVIVCAIVLINIINSPIFRSQSYYQRITVTTSNFASDVAQVDFEKLALLDKTSSV